MRVKLLIISHLFPQRMLEWAGVFITREAAYLADHGIDSRFLVPRPLAPWPLHLHPRWRLYGPRNPILPPEGVAARVVRYPRPPGEWFRTREAASMTRASLPAALRWHREEPFDLVLGVDMLAEVPTAIAVAGRLGVPAVGLSIGSDLMLRPRETPGLVPGFREALERLDLAVGVSDSLCRRMGELAPDAPPPMRVYLSRDSRRYRPARDRSALRRQLGWSDDDLVLVFVGRLEAPKGMRELTAVIPSLVRRHPRLRFVCIGEGSERAALEKAAVDGGRPDAVVLTGRLEPDGVIPHLQASDAMVFPSHSEGLPQAVLEAMNCGLPVVATNVGGIPEAVVHEETGLLVEPRDPAALESAIERMLASPEFRHDAGRRGLERAHDVFDPDANARDFAARLRALAMRGRGSPSRAVR